MSLPRVLPPELIGSIARWAARADLPSLALVSRTFHAETTRLLYRSVSLSTPTATIAFNRTVSEQKVLAHLVVALDVTTPNEAWCHTPWRKLVHLRRLSLETHSMFDQLALVPDDLLEAFQLNSARYADAGETHALESFLRRQCRLTHLTLYTGSQRRGSDRDGGPAMLHSARLQSFLTGCPRSVKSLAIGLPFDKQLSALFAISTSLPDLVSLRSSVIDVAPDMALRGFLKTVAKADELPSFGHLRTVELYSPEVPEANVGDLFALCRNAFGDWKKSMAPGLERFTMSWGHNSIYTVHNISFAPKQ